MYSGHPNRLERYQQYDTMDGDSEVNAALDILAEFCSQTNEENGTPFQIFFKDQATQPEIKVISAPALSDATIIFILSLLLACINQLAEII